MTRPNQLFDRLPRVSVFNAWLDTLPRTRLGKPGPDWPAYRAMGVAGFYAALLVTVAGGLLAQRSLVVLSGTAALAGVSFFAYAWLRKWITGRERIVLLEHVWFSLVWMSALLYSLREPVLSYLDVVAPALCVFLAVGRIGCTLAGCCHGIPASVGIRYGNAHRADGFPADLVGVRLFPVPGLEALGLLMIGAGGFAALPWSPPGTVLAWFLLAYAVLRFGMEGLRGDSRPHLLGLSIPRWMCLLQAAAVLVWDAWMHGSRSNLYLAGALGLTTAAALLWKYRTDAHRVLLGSAHVAEVRAILEHRLAQTLPPPGSPVVVTSSRGVSLAISASPRRGWAHISMALPHSRGDLRLLCELAARSSARWDALEAWYTATNVLHIPAQCQLGMASAVSWEEIYGHAVRHMQNEHWHSGHAPETTLPVTGLRTARPWYFTMNGTR